MSGEIVNHMIDFWLHGPRQSLGRAVTRLTQTGFALDHWMEEPEGVVLAREGTAAFVSFRAWTPQPVQGAGRFGIECDGWQTFVVKDRPSASNAPEYRHEQSLLGKLFGKRKH